MINTTKFEFHVNFVPNFRHEHDIVSKSLDTKMIRTRIQVLISGQFRFVTCFIEIATPSCSSPP